MSFYQDRSFGMKFGPVKWDFYLKSVKVNCTSCIINELLRKLSISPEIWSNDRIWDVDYKNNNVHCHIMHNQWVHLWIINEGLSKSSILDEICSSDKKLYFDYKNNKID